MNFDEETCRQLDEMAAALDDMASVLSRYHPETVTTTDIAHIVQRCCRLFIGAAGVFRKLAADGRHDPRCSDSPDDPAAGF